MSQKPQQQEVPGVQSEMDPVPDCGEETYRGSGKLTDKVAVITGGDSGIGRAVAIAYAREGADVVISYLSEHEDAKDTARLGRAGRSPRRTRRGRRLAGRALPRDRRHDGARARPHRRPGQQRGVPDEPRRPRGDQRRGVGLHLRHQRLRDVLPGEGGAAAHAAGVVDHRQHVGELRHAVPAARAVRRDEGRDRQLLRQPRADAGAARHPGQQRGARPDLDAADPGDDAAGEGREVRRRHPAGPTGTARRAGAAPTCCWPPTRAATCRARGSR